MRFSVCHVTEYHYSAPVRLGPQTLRLTPRAEGITLHSYALLVDPQPSTRATRLDPYDNPVTVLQFDGLTPHLRLESRFTLDTHAPAPLAGRFAPLPWPLAPGATLPDPAVCAFAAQLAEAADWQAPAFLALLTRTLYTRTDRHIRPDGFAQSPEHTLASARGACRDLAVLFIAACASLGILARFVSGYQARAESVDGQRHLHGWAEAFLPGLGWRGYDPTHGVALSDGHVALAVAADQSATMPLEGGFWGQGVTARMSYAIEIDATD